MSWHHLSEAGHSHARPRMHFLYIKGTTFFSLCSQATLLFSFMVVVYRQQSCGQHWKEHMLEITSRILEMDERFVILYWCDKIPNSKFNMTRKWIAVHIFLQTLGKSCIVTIFMDYSNHLWDSHWKPVTIHGQLSGWGSIVGDVTSIL